MESVQEDSRLATLLWWYETFHLLNHRLKIMVIANLVGKVVCSNILKFNNTNTETDMLWHAFLFSNISKFFILLNCWWQQHWNWKLHQKKYIIKNIFYCCTIHKKYLILIKEQLNVFFYYFYFPDKYSTYDIFYMSEKYFLRR